MNAATFAPSAALVAGVGAVGGGRRAGTTATLDHGRVLAQLVGGFQALGRLPGLAVMTVFSVGVLLAYGIEQVVHVLVAGGPSSALRRQHGVGILNACMGAGGMAAIPFSAWLASRREAGARCSALSGVLMGMPLALLAVVSSPVVAGVLMVVEGFGNILFDVLLITLLQRHLPRGAARSRTRCRTAVALRGRPVGRGHGRWRRCSSPGSDLEVTLRGSARRVARRPDPRAHPSPAGDLQAHERRAGTAGPPRGRARERSGSSPRRPSPHASASPGRQTPGTSRPAPSCSTEGDEPDDLYIVRSGEVAVMADRGEIRRVGAGEWFGRSGCCAACRGTVSIVVVADAELLAISGREFLDAVTGSNRLPEPIAGAIVPRLAATHPDLVER